MVDPAEINATISWLVGADKLEAAQGVHFLLANRADGLGRSVLCRVLEGRAAHLQPEPPPRGDAARAARAER
jgi:hypothetical protein